MICMHIRQGRMMTMHIRELNLPKAVKEKEQKRYEKLCEEFGMS